MHIVVQKILRCYHAASRSAHMGERPLHMTYFVFVAYEAHGAYGIVAGVCAVVMFLTISE